MRQSTRARASARLNLGYEAANGALLGIENVLLVFVGAHEVLSGALTIGMLYAFIAYRTHFASAMNSLIAQIVQFLMLRLHLERIADIALTEPEHRATAASTFIAPVRGALTLERLCFAYPGDAGVLLENLDLRIEPGQHVAIVGPSGVGKSTLLRLLLGLAPPDLRPRRDRWRADRTARPEVVSRGDRGGAARRRAAVRIDRRQRQLLRPDAGCADDRTRDAARADL